MFSNVTRGILFDTSGVETYKSSAKESDFVACADETSAILSPLFMVGGDSWHSIKQSKKGIPRLASPLWYLVSVDYLFT